MKAYTVDDPQGNRRYYKTKQDALLGFHKARRQADLLAEHSEYSTHYVTLSQVNIATDRDTLFDLLNGDGGYIDSEETLENYESKPKWNEGRRETK